MKSSTLVTISVLVALIAAAFCILYFAGTSIVPSVAAGLTEESSVQSSELIGNRAPYFNLPDIAGVNVKLTQFSGPLVLVFWSTWNAQATDQMKILDDYIASGSSKRSIDVVSIDSQEESSVVTSFMDRGGYKVPTLLDSMGSVSGQYKIKAVPTFIFIDRTGTVREVYAGVLSVRDIESKVETLLRY